MFNVIELLNLLQRLRQSSISKKDSFLILINPTFLPICAVLRKHPRSCPFALFFFKPKLSFYLFVPYTYTFGAYLLLDGVIASAWSHPPLFFLVAGVSSPSPDWAVMSQRRLFFAGASPPPAEGPLPLEPLTALREPSLALSAIWPRSAF